LYENWADVTVTKAAECLGVTKTSVSRCFDELEVLNIPYLKIRNRGRRFSVAEDKKRNVGNHKTDFAKSGYSAYILNEILDKSLGWED
jgi:hypothetical protein